MLIYQAISSHNDPRHWIPLYSQYCISQRSNHHLEKSISLEITSWWGGKHKGWWTTGIFVLQQTQHLTTVAFQLVSMSITRVGRVLLLLLLLGFNSKANCFTMIMISVWHCCITGATSNNNGTNVPETCQCSPGYGAEYGPASDCLRCPYGKYGDGTMVPCETCPEDSFTLTTGESTNTLVHVSMLMHPSAWLVRSWKRPTIY
jgi:hypothetical protein